MTPAQVHQQQSDLFRTRKTFDVSYRIQALKKLKSVLEKNENEVYKALKQDLGKSEFEAFVTEFQVVMGELDTYIKKTRTWSRPKKVSAALLNFPSKARRYPEPYGNTLIISPWNYPFQLALAPLIGAIAAGNTVVLKPSEFSSATSDLLKRICEESFESGHVNVVLGDGEIAQELTSLSWDYIFFTGSPGVGKKIYQAAAKHLTPVTLELGGKNPAVVHDSANLEVCAKRIAWAKFLNTGQTCIAPDYLLVHHTVKAKFVEQLKAAIVEFFGENPQESTDYPRIIRDAHFDALKEMIDDGTILYGGDNDKSELYIAPTLLDEPARKSKVMKDEIFGPILPIISYKDKSDLERWITSYDKPLGAYVYAGDSDFTDWFIERFSFGGGAVNDSMVQFLNERLPFGGVGTSGIGSYHGKKTFETFSHYKSVVHRGTWLDISLKYPPYNKSISLVKKFLKWI
ncbi:aldehyde dehydrogenase [Nonlabens agnitus]|uniref:Aldehyde dehydrogenase n=1 Tax=Nonlabens agnitus TaxID=870484 RepID=A0A2S9WYA6_9FLAO|nr:aldehyde dehydrogenase [Nonlabens agnitus]PRP66594.1 aldehyde dehydrogenase [Nonlabens agnitus]PRP68452.1 aldehyde dehydrogenase [Nonlabens agnitus]